MTEDKALPMYTINDPKGEPYISVVDDGDLVRIQLHRYDGEFARGIYFNIDRRAVPELIESLCKIKS